MHARSDQKAAFRQAARTARKAAHAAQPDAAGSLCRHFLAAGFVAGAGAGAGRKTVSGYCPIRTEIDPMPLMRALHGLGHRLCVPVIEAAGRPLRFRAWRPGAAMRQGEFGAAVPVEGAWLAPEILLVPLLAFDASGYRLGYGGGFYDRTLAELRAVRPTTAIGLAYRAQMVDAVPVEPTDQRLDAVVTEAGVHHPATEGTA